MFERVGPDEAVRLLAEESEIGKKANEDGLEEIAALLDFERPALRWAAARARVTGFRSLSPRLTNWSVGNGSAPYPWRAEVETAVAALAPADRELLALLAACDAAFAWDLLEDVAAAAFARPLAVESAIALESAKLLVRSAREGVVTFFVPFTVRAIVREPAHAARWLDAWTRRAAELQPSTYGVTSRAALAELAAAIPLATRALATDDAAKASEGKGADGMAANAGAGKDPSTATKGLALWLAASDSLFFGGSLPFDAPAFERAVVVADGNDDVEAKTRARTVAARARLERGDPAGALAMLREAEAANAAPTTPPDAHLGAEIQRGIGWAALALADFDAAKAAFDVARAAREPRTQADAAAGLGIRALMNGDAGAARGFLEESLAIHVVMRDAPREASVRGMMELLPSASASAAPTSDLAADVEKFRASGQRWREALTLARLALAARARGDADAERARLLEARAAATLAKVPASELVRPLVERTSAKPIVVGAEGRSLTMPGGETHDLARHGPVRRILLALASARVERPGVAMSTLDVIDAGWPGEKMQHEAATLRVYTTIRRLRGFGLEGVLVTRDEGYLLDPDVPLTLG